MNISSRVRRIESLFGKLDSSGVPAVWRGRPVVPRKEWKWEDSSSFPDSYIPSLLMPRDWEEDYCDLMEHILDESYSMLAKCYYCPLNREGVISRYEGVVDHHDSGMMSKLIGILEVGISEETGGPFEFENPCSVVNYFRCPHPKDKDLLIGLGHVIWYVRGAIGYYIYETGKNLPYPERVKQSKELLKLDKDELNQAFELYNKYCLGVAAESGSDIQEEIEHYNTLKKNAMDAIAFIVKKLEVLSSRV